MEATIKVFDSLEAAKESWLNFQEKGELYFFQTYEWLENWYGSIGKERSIRPCLVAVLAESGEPLCFLPFEIEKRGSLRVLAWLGEGLIDYGAPIVCPLSFDMCAKDGGKEFKGIWEAVLKRIPAVDYVSLKRIPAIINGHDNPFCSLPCQRYHTRGYHSNLSDNWDGFYKQHAGAKTRSTDRRKYRRLSEAGKISFAMTDGSDQAIYYEITQAMIEQKKGRYRDIQAADFLDPDCHKRFFMNPSAGLLSSGALHVSALYLDDRILTTHWGMMYRDRFYYFMPSFASGSWERYSPGRLLLFRLFELCFQRNIKVFDFTIGDEHYKRDWCDSELPLYQYFRAVTWRGRIIEPFHRLFAAIFGVGLFLGAARRLRRLFYRMRYLTA